MSRNPFAYLFPESRVVRFFHRQDRAVFFAMVNDLVQSHFAVLDFGAGRGRQTEVGGRYLRMISIYRERCAKIIGVHIDPIVMQNPVMEEAHVLAPDGKIPLADASVDLTYCCAVLEHIDKPEQVVSEIARVLKPGGWFCAWTPNKWGYVGIGARLVPNRAHAKLLSFVQPSRKEKDIFPTRYRMSTLGRIRRLFPDQLFENYSFGFNAQPSYNFGSAFFAWLWNAYIAITPRALAQYLFVFVRKRARDGGQL